MKIIFNIINWIKTYLPKNEIDTILYEIKKIENDECKYHRVAAMYLKLHTIYGLMLGKTDDDDYNYFLADLYYKKYEWYRSEYFKLNS